MNLYEVTCPNCGATLQVDTSREAEICVSCNQPFVVATALNKYAQSMQGAQLEDGLRKADTFMHVREWKSAYNVFLELSSIYPHDARTWLGIARALSQERSKHDVTQDELNNIQDYIQKARIINSYIADNAWDVYLENEQDRLDRAEQMKEMTRRKLQSEYDQLVHRAKHTLETVLRVQKTKRHTMIGLGLGLILVSLIIFGVLWYGKETMWSISYPMLNAVVLICGVVAGIGAICWLIGICTRAKKVYLSASDVEDYKRAVKMLQNSAKRAGVELNTSEPIRTYITSKQKRV